jgi:hypothetical protein
MTAIKLLSPFALFVSGALCQNPAVLTVQSALGGSVTLSVPDLSTLPQRTVKATVNGALVEFEGVLLADALAKVKLPVGESYHSTAASYYLEAEGSDGYRAVFAWAELDPAFMDKAVYVVTKRDGKPLQAKDGPFQLVAPGEKRNGRWVRQLKSLRVEPLPGSTADDSSQARWVNAVALDIQTIKPGMTRAQLLKVFAGEGGVSTRIGRRYVYRRCGFIKVDVEFAPSGNPNSRAESPDDVITKISKPYLDQPVTD